MDAHEEYKQLKARHAKGELTDDELDRELEHLANRHHEEHIPGPVCFGIQLPVRNKAFWLILLIFEAIFWLPLLLPLAIERPIDHAQATARFTMNYLVMCVAVSLGTSPFFCRHTGDAVNRRIAWSKQNAPIARFRIRNAKELSVPLWLFEHTHLPCFWLLLSVQVFPAVSLHPFLISGSKLILCTPLLAIACWTYSRYRIWHETRFPPGSVLMSPKQPKAGQVVEGYAGALWHRKPPTTVELRLARTEPSSVSVSSPQSAEIIDTTCECQQLITHFKFLFPEGVTDDGTWRFELSVRVESERIQLKAPLVGLPR